jgi:hypothetical protein
VLRLMRVVVLIFALSLILLGFLGGSAGIVLSVMGSDADRLVMVTLSVSLTILTVSFGMLLAWHAWQAIQGTPSAVFQPKRTWPLGLLFVLALATGHLVLSMNLQPLVTFPLLHVAATALPPMVILVLVSRGLGGITTWRDVVLQVASGAFLGIFLAFFLEAVAGLGVLAATSVGVVLQPGGQQSLEKIATHLNDPAWLQDVPSFAPAFASSPLILAAVFVFLAAVIPFIEEGAKTIGVGLMGYRRPTLPQAFLWGLAGGAGFAFVEGLLNTAGSLEGWTLIVVVRVGATLLHCLTGALMGLAWYSLLARRRLGYGLGLFFASVAVHSIWNALSTVNIFFSLQTLEAKVTSETQMMAGLGILAIFVGLFILAMVTALVLMGLTLYVRKRSPPPESSELHFPVHTTDLIPPQE